MTVMYAAAAVASANTGSGSCQMCGSDDSKLALCSEEFIKGALIRKAK